ncbi:hypothetical protein MP638_003072, partial [Amoeboaphelidium occidentale]
GKVRDVQEQSTAAEAKPESVAIEPCRLNSNRFWQAVDAGLTAATSSDMFDN